MRKITYYVAVSLDGFIAGPGDDISLFRMDGNGVDQYLEDLKSYDTVIMGRKTYEFGYDFGLEAGQPAYPHMEHYIFSNSLELPDKHPKVHIERPDLQIIDQLRNSTGSDIYLCGGGHFAGWLLDHGRINTLKIKRNPILLGGGVPLFGMSTTQLRLELVSCESFEHGLQILTYNIPHAKEKP